MINTYGGGLMADMNLRDVPEDLHRKAKAEAALEGISLKALVIKALEEYLKKKKRWFYEAPTIYRPPFNIFYFGGQ